MSLPRWLRSPLLRFAALRRLITIPSVLAFTALTFLLVPLIGIVTAPFTLRPGGRGRAFRFGVFLAVYLGCEVTGLAACLAMWIARRLGRSVAGHTYQDASYRLLARLLSRLHSAAVRFYGLQILLPESPGAPPPGTLLAPELPPGPLIILSRHGGPGDSFLLVHALLVHANRRPRIVLKDTLALDPLIDVVLHRVPHCFIDPGPVGGDRGDRDDGCDDVAERDAAAAGIGRLAAGMGPADALVVFPEGGNFTPERRRRAIARLRRRGLRESANRARRLRHVLPPRPAGVFAALDAAPQADVVFVAHTGLDHMTSVADVWRSIPLTEPVRATWWTAPAAGIPAGRPERLRWLQDNWAAVDAWIGRHVPDAVPSGAESVASPPVPSPTES